MCTSGPARAHQAAKVTQAIGLYPSAGSTTSISLENALPRIAICGAGLNGGLRTNFVISGSLEDSTVFQENADCPQTLTRFLTFFFLRIGMYDARYSIVKGRVN